MSTKSLRVSDKESKLIRDYIAINQLNMSQFIRECILEKIEYDLQLDEERILKSIEQSKIEKRYNHADVWKELGV